MIRAATIPALRGPVVLAAPAGSVPVTGRQAGQRLARTELSKAIYHHQPSLTERVARNSRASQVSRKCATRSVSAGWWW